ncbi:MAG: amidohydrolase [Candidatus Latescibacterota bacterium]|nr:MAG: amidohydrolase [Candidatus Latescibacterota bacterium]
MTIDGHTHLYDEFLGQRGAEVEEFLEGLSSAGVDKAIVFTVKGLYGDCRRHNDSLYEATKGYRDRLVPFCTVSPNDGPEAVEELRRCVRELGMPGVKFHPWLQSFPPVHPWLGPIFEELKALGVPAVFHDGTPPYSAPLQIAYIASQFPQVPVILGHSGLHDMWREALRAARKLDNIYLCTCGSTFLALRTMAQVVGASRMIYGSDFLLGGVEGMRYQLKLVDLLPLPEDDKEKILGGNLMDLVPVLRS